MKGFSISLVVGLILQMEYVYLDNNGNDVPILSSSASAASSLSPITERTTGSMFKSKGAAKIKDCSTGQPQCDSATAICVNKNGSYRCECRNGYAKFNKTCTDRDECTTTGKSLCNAATTNCINTAGSYYCSCRNGYRSTSSRTSCTDIDECNTWSSRCDYNTTNCVNTAGSYLCPCKSGYENYYWNSRSTICTDVDECERGIQLCDNLTTICINSAGSYQCTCRTGFERENDTTCSDIDECISDDSECDLMSTDCINTIGNYTCGCKDGFTYLNETTCLEKRLGLIVGSSVAAFLVAASLTILLLLFCWKRRKEVNQPQETESSGVDNGSNAVRPMTLNLYMPLDVTACDKTRKRMNYTPIDESTLLSAPNKKPKETVQPATYENVQPSTNKKPKETVQPATYENVQPSTNAKGLCCIDEDVQPVNYENVELPTRKNVEPANYENVELPTHKNA